MQDKAIIIELKITKQKIKSDIIFKHSISYPLLELGFVRYYHIDRLKFNNIIEKFKNKTKIYLIINKYNKDLLNVETKKIYHIEPNTSFYKLWEILNIFSLLLTKSSIKTLHLQETNSSFVQAIKEYRNNKSDTYFCQLLHGTKLKNITYLEDDIYNVKLKEKVDLITGNTDIDSVIDVIQEQHSYSIILQQINIMQNTLHKNGIFICKFFEMFTLPTCKIIELLTQMFTKSYIIKPLTSPSGLSERYFVGIGYNDFKIELDTLIKKIKSSKEHVVDLFNDIIIENKNEIILANTIISNNQFKNINEIITYVDNEVYLGDEFHKYEQEQKDSTKKWIDLYYEKTDFKNLQIDILNYYKNYLKQ